MSSSSDDLARKLGQGHPGEVRVGPGGQLYTWAVAFDNLGNELGGSWVPWQPEAGPSSGALDGERVCRLFEQHMGAPLPTRPHVAPGPLPGGSVVRTSGHHLFGWVAAVDRAGRPLGGFWLQLGGLGTPPSELAPGPWVGTSPGEVRWSEGRAFGWVATESTGFWTPLLRPGRPPRGSPPRACGLVGFGVEGGGLVGVYQVSTGGVYIAPYLLAASEPEAAGMASHLARRGAGGLVLRRLEQVLAAQPPRVQEPPAS